MNKVLIIVDMQNDFVYGNLKAETVEMIIPAIKNKIDNYDGKIIFTQDTHYPNYLQTPEGKKLPILHCLDGDDGWKVIPELDIPDCLHIKKETFGYTNWFTLGCLCDADEIELCGVCTDICVVSNALILKAMFPNAVIKVNGWLCAGTSEVEHLKALSIMTDCQIDVYYE